MTVKRNTDRFADISRYDKEYLKEKGKKKIARVGRGRQRLSAGRKPPAQA